jgi:hypothetical protein
VNLGSGAKGCGGRIEEVTINKEGYSCGVIIISLRISFDAKMRGEGADVFRKRGAEPGKSAQDARKQALGICKHSVKRENRDPAHARSVRELAAQVLLALPPGPWWAIQRRLEGHLQAAMSNERIGSQYLPAPGMLQAMAKWGIAMQLEELICVATELKAWHKSKGILISAFTTGLMTAFAGLGVKTDLETKQSPASPVHQQFEDRTRSLAQGDSLAETCLSNDPIDMTRSVQFSHCDEVLSPIDSLVHHSSAEQHAVDPAPAKDWRMTDLLRIRDAEKRNKPAVTKTWQTVQMPTGALLHTQQIGLCDLRPSSGLTTPRNEQSVGHLTNSELMVLRSLKRSTRCDQSLQSELANSFHRLATLNIPRRKQLASALMTRSSRRCAHLVPELNICMPHVIKSHESGAQTERAVRATKPQYFGPTTPLISGGMFHPHPSWAPTGDNRCAYALYCAFLVWNVGGDSLTPI